MPGMLVFVMAVLIAQQPVWKEFSIGPATRKTAPNSTDLSRGVLHSGSISLRSLLAIATAMPPSRILGPEWIDTEHYAVSAEISDESRLRLRTRSQADAPVAAVFRSLLMQEMGSLFHLECHRENRNGSRYTLQVVEGRKLNARQAVGGERGHFNRSGTPLVNTETTLTAKAVTFPSFCDWLQKYLKTPVIPDTSLPEGAWNFRLKWRTDSEASLLAALREQLGIELAREDGNQVYLVVDRVERQNLP
jgi:uncharacterized protein (TIGR03435 family)